jgi:hypothetical protein
MSSILATLQKFNELRKALEELPAIVEQGKIERGAQLWLQIEEEHPAIADTFKALIFKSPQELADTITSYTQVKFTPSGVENLGKIQKAIREKRVTR